ncbi:MULTISPECIES: TMEM43 family protein [Alphaproteobacteria]|uniref:Uncharacterized protein n=2 Tax=Alphaproteobacteria TaxID=28211 RepID=A0A512HIQ5_9HYPH|nr:MULTISPECIES: TMEM43 family protein [Alphaproteobacteria]GEO85317.1 hypothetical protein RNA01_22490 [Ciceribacter naphthalenivorans]GLR20956.1 hypothetical protein GCM10007920_07410 [Ciceribacter naphthalenivorans]GLT03812.1 hypothetical protein GCM10007926_07410 [Sphingomonas psychrolutea]
MSRWCGTRAIKAYWTLTEGAGLVVSILGVLADVVPLAGSLVRFGTGLTALILTVAVGALGIAVGWFRRRSAVRVAPSP